LKFSETTSDLSVREFRQIVECKQLLPGDTWNNSIAVVLLGVALFYECSPEIC